MRNLWWDGFFAESSDVIWLQYFSLFALALGANLGLIGVLAAMGNLLAALSMWPGAMVAERTRRYKYIVLLSAGGLSRLALLLLAATPWIASGKAALGIVVAVAALRGFLSSVAMPAWSAFAAQFVPERMRGRYFASRNFARQIAGLGTAPLVGFLVYRLGDFDGWQTAWLMAFVLGMISSVFYARIPTDAAERPAMRVASPPPAGARSAMRDGRLLWLVAASGLFQLSVMLAGPFFSIYLVQRLGGSTLWVGATASAMAVGGIVAQPMVGKLNDRFGPKWLLIASGLMFPVVPWLWTIASEPWHAVFPSLLGGVLWAANLLASFNLLLEIAPPARRPTYAGLQQAGVFFASFLGPLIGGFLIPLVGFKAVFLISGGGRLAATILLWCQVSIDPATDAGDPRARAKPLPA